MAATSENLLKFNRINSEKEQNSYDDKYHFSVKRIKLYTKDYTNILNNFPKHLDIWMEKIIESGILFSRGIGKDLVVEKWVT